MTQPFTPNFRPFVHNSQTYTVSLEPLPPHIPSMLEYYQEWQMYDSGGLDLPYTFENFMELCMQVDAIESMGVAAYRAVVLKPIHQTQTELRDASGTTQVAGIIYVQVPAQLDHTAVLGTWLFKPFQGKGLNSIVKQQMIQLAQEAFHCSTIIWLIAETNERAIRASDKLPFVTQVSNPNLSSDLLAYKKWTEFKTGRPSVLFRVKTYC